MRACKMPVDCYIAGAFFALPCPQLQGIICKKNQIPQECRAALEGTTTSSQPKTVRVTKTTSATKTTKAPGEQLSKHVCICVALVRKCMCLYMCVGAFVCAVGI